MPDFFSWHLAETYFPEIGDGARAPLLLRRHVLKCTLVTHQGREGVSLVNDWDVVAIFLLGGTLSVPTPGVCPLRVAKCPTRGGWVREVLEPVQAVRLVVPRVLPGKF